jgi:hypothetical protein
MGLIVGVVVVIAIAVLFFRNDAPAGLPLAGEAAAASVSVPKAGAARPSQSLSRPVRAKPTIQTEPRSEAVSLTGQQAGGTPPSTTDAKQGPLLEEDGTP